MAVVNVTRRFAASQELVWSTISDPSRFAEWLTLHQKWKTEPPTTLSEGAQMSEVLSIMNMPNTIDFVVQDYDAPNRTSFSGTGMAGAQITFTLRVQPDGEEASTVGIDAEFVSQMMVGAVGGAIERASKKELETSLDNLEKLIEGAR